MIETIQTIPVADLMAESVRRLRASLQAERIYLFGSRARDEADEEIEDLPDDQPDEAESNLESE